MQFNDFSWRFRGQGARKPDTEPARRARIRIGGKVAKAMLKSHVSPVYPPEAIEARVEGLVVLEVWVAEDGTVESTKLNSGPPMLVESAIDAVARWKYQPAVIGVRRRQDNEVLVPRQAVAFITTVEISFALTSEERG